MDTHLPPPTAPEPSPTLPPRPLRRWDGGMALIYFVTAALISFVAALALAGTSGFYTSIIISEVAAFVLIPLALRPLFDTGWRTWTKAPDVEAGFWVWCMIAVGSFAVVQSNVPVLLDRLWPIPQEHFEFYRQYLAAGSPLELVMLLLTAAVVPGICEEVAFRGLIQTGLRRSFGQNAAILWGGALFALLHLNPWNFIGLWTFGALLGYLRERTGSVYPSIAAHVANNATALVIFSLQRPEDWEKPPEFLPWYVTAPAGLILIYAVLQLHRHTRHTAASKQPTGPLGADQTPLAQ